MIHAAGLPVERPMHALAISGERPCATLAPRRKVRAVQECAETDEAVLARVARGDRDAFAIAFNRYASRLKGYLIRLGAPVAAADDLAQDAMLSVWRRAASFDAAKAKASTWIFVIARNAWIDKLRREKIELAYRNSAVMSDESEDEAPDDAAERVDDENKVEAALATLSEEQRQVVRLSFFEDRPHAEISQALSLPLGTVKSRLRLALIKLRAHWEQYQ